MYTSILSLGLLLAPIANTTPAWQPSYAAALDVGQKQNRPLAVFFGKGANGASQSVKEGQLPEEAAKVLTQHFVCVYLDQAQNERLVRDFGITSGAGLVISDRSGKVQAFHYDGKLSQTELVQRLRQFAEAPLNIRTTVSNSNARVSYYGDPGAAPAAGNGSGYFRPATFAPSFGGGRPANC